MSSSGKEAAGCHRDYTPNPPPESSGAGTSLERLRGELRTNHIYIQVTLVSLVIKGQLEWEGKDPREDMRDMIVLPAFLVSGVHGNKVPNPSHTPSCLTHAVCQPRSVMAPHAPASAKAVPPASGPLHILSIIAFLSFICATPQAKVSL